MVRCIHAYHHSACGHARPAGWVCPQQDRRLVDINPAVDCINCPRYEELQRVRYIPPEGINLERLAGELDIG